MGAGHAAADVGCRTRASAGDRRAALWTAALLCGAGRNYSGQCGVGAAQEQCGGSLSSQFVWRGDDPEAEEHDAAGASRSAGGRLCNGWRLVSAERGRRRGRGQGDRLRTAAARRSRAGGGGALRDSGTGVRGAAAGGGVSDQLLIRTQRNATLPPTHSAKSAEWMGHSVSKFLGRINSWRWLSGGFLNQSNKEAVGVKSAREQAEKAFRGERAAQALCALVGENAFDEQRFNSGYERNRAGVWRCGQDRGDDLFVFFRLQREWRTGVRPGERDRPCGGGGEFPGCGPAFRFRCRARRPARGRRRSLRRA